MSVSSQLAAFHQRRALSAHRFQRQTLRKFRNGRTSSNHQSGALSDARPRPTTHWQITIQSISSNSGLPRFKTVKCINKVYTISFTHFYVKRFEFSHHVSKKKIFLYIFMPFYSFYTILTMPSVAVQLLRSQQS